MGSPLSMPDFIAVVEQVDRQLSTLTEEETINVLINLLKRAVERHGSYPPYIIDAVIDVLNARIFFDPSLAPGSRRVDN